MDNSNDRFDYGNGGFSERPAKRRVNWLGLALMLIVLGGIMASAAWMFGARGGVIAWDGGPVFFASPAESVQTHTVTVSPQNINELRVDASSARIRILQNHHGGNFEIEFVNLEPNYTVSGNRLLVDARPDAGIRGGFNLFGGGFGGHAVNLYVPVGMEFDVTLESSSGGVLVEHPFFNSLGIRSSSGSIILGPAEVMGRLSLSSSSGRITAENIAAPNGEFSSSSGSIIVSNSRWGNLYVSSSSGRQEITNNAWTNLEASSSSGRISIEAAEILPPPGSTNISASSGGVSLAVLGRESDFSYNLSSTSGSRRVNGVNMDSSVNRSGNLHDISIRTTSGSIRLDFE